MSETEPDKETAENGIDRTEHGQFAEGNPGGPGRPKGSLNQLSRAAAESILASLERRGGAAYLDRLDDPLFVALLKTILPRRIDSDLTTRTGDLPAGPITVTFDIGTPGRKRPIGPPIIDAEPIPEPPPALPEPDQPGPTLDTLAEKLRQLHIGVT